MTDGISINQFRAQVDQSQSLGAKVKLGGEDGLKAYGNSLLGKVACWFQKSAARKEQSQDVRQSFIESIQREYGTDSIVDDITNRLSGNKRLSLRTIQTTLDTLDTHRSRMTDIFTELGEKMGFDPPMQEGRLDMEQLGTLRQEIAQDILRMQQGQPGGITEEQAQNITKTKIEKYIVENISINNTEDAVKFLGNVSNANYKTGVQNVFDQLIEKEGGLDMLRNASKQLLAGELSEATPDTYIRNDSAPILLTTTILKHMTQEINHDLIGQLQESFPEDLPTPTLPDGKPNPAYGPATLEFAQNCFEEIQNTWAKNMSTETKEFINEIRDLSSQFKGNLGDRAGYKIANHFMSLRVLNPLLFNEGARLNLEANTLTQAGNLEGGKKSKAMSRAMIDVAKGIQTLFNTAHREGSSLDGLLANKIVGRISFIKPLITDETNRMAVQVMVDVLSMPLEDL